MHLIDGLLRYDERLKKNISIRPCMSLAEDVISKHTIFLFEFLDLAYEKDLGCRKFSFHGLISIHRHFNSLSLALSPLHNPAIYLTLFGSLLIEDSCEETEGLFAPVYSEQKRIEILTLLHVLGSCQFTASYGSEFGTA